MIVPRPDLKRKDAKTPRHEDSAALRFRASAPLR